MLRQFCAYTAQQEAFKRLADQYKRERQHVEKFQRENPVLARPMVYRRTS